MGLIERIRKAFAGKEKRASGFLTTSDAYDLLCTQGYTRLDRCPEVIAGCRRIAEIISGMTIHLMSNTNKGDVRIINELSRKVDIDPIPTMTRKHWMDAIVMNMLLYGEGNAIVLPHTYNGIIQSLEPIAAERVSFLPADRYRYKVMIDGAERDPDNLLHFVFNPDPHFLWKGQGLRVALKDTADILKQAKETEKGFMQSKWKPSLIVKVDGLVDEFASPEGRQKLLNSYVSSAGAGEPWMIPADQFDVKEVRPLSLADLAINDTVELDKRTVASILGAPPFVLGVGDYNATAWNGFISNTIRPICREIEQELTRKLLLSPKWYFRMNIQSLMDYDLSTVSSVFASLADRGIVTGNEVRDRMGMSPMDGLDELRLLENYLPIDRLGDQKKLTQED